MSRKSTKNYSKLLGGLGAMYALSKLPVGEGVRPEDVNQADAAAYREAEAARIAKLPRSSANPPFNPVSESEANAPLKSRVVYPPSDTYEDSLKRRAESSKRLAEVTDRINREFPTNTEPTNRKKGGAVKGWGKARGARAAKVY